MSAPSVSVVVATRDRPELLARAAGRIEILPAGGVRPSNALALLQRTRCDQLHSSLRERGTGGMSRRLLSELIIRLRPG